MKMLEKLIKAFVLCLPLSCFATWQLATPNTAIPREPYFQAGTQQQATFKPSTYAQHALPNQYATLGQDAPAYAITINGSVKENIERIMHRYHWKVLWKAPYDYNFDGRVTGASLANVIQKLLDPFPLQAVMYMSNRTIAIIPRNKIGKEVS